MNIVESIIYRLRVSKILSYVLIFSTSVLIAIIAVPETIALRNSFLIVGAIFSILFIILNKEQIFQKGCWPLVIVPLFFMWVLIQFYFFSQNPTLQFHELKSTWLRCLLSSLIGFSCGLYLSAPNENKYNKKYEFNLQFYIILFGISFPFLLSIIYFYLNPNNILDNIIFSLFQAKQPIVIQNAILLPLCFLCIYNYDISHNNKFILFICSLLIAISIVVSYLINSKNAIIIFIIALIFFIFFYIKNTRNYLKNSLSQMVIIITLGVFSSHFILSHINTNSAFFQMISDIKVGIAIDKNNYWKNSSKYAPPINELNLPVNISTYERVAWFHAGLLLSIDNPLGYGLINHSFGALAKMRWSDFGSSSDAKKGSTHSGLLDFLLGFGYPGLMIILSSLGVSWNRAIRRQTLWFRFSSLAIPLLVFAYLTTEVAVGHFIELLFLMVSFFCGLTLRYRDKA